MLDTLISITVQIVGSLAILAGLLWLLGEGLFVLLEKRQAYAAALVVLCRWSYPSEAELNLWYRKAYDQIKKREKEAQERMERSRTKRRKLVRYADDPVIGGGVINPPEGE